MDASRSNEASNERAADAFFARLGGDPIVEAFAGAPPVHPFPDVVPVPEEATAATWATMAATRPTGAAVAYVHVPYCANHCLFCGFYRHAWRESEGTAYVDAVLDHLVWDSLQATADRTPLRAVYLGGGTPTVLATADLVRLLEGIRRHLPLADDCEVTVEGRVHGFGIDKARAACDAGANRFSLGVQTFDDRLRHRLGRKAEARGVKRFLEELRDLDRAAVVVDLIYGLPEQSLDHWRRDVATVATLALDGVDLYSLKLIPGTPLASALAKGKFQATAASAFGLYYRAGAAILADAGWQALSTSHWARTPRERSLYNSLVKSGADCLAFGAGAGGSLADHSYGTLADIGAYSAAVARREPPVAGLFRHTSTRLLASFLQGAMDKGVVDRAALAALAADTPHVRSAALFDPLLAQWAEAGLMTLDAERVELTEAGRFWQPTMTQHLLTWLREAKHRPPRSGRGEPDGTDR